MKVFELRNGISIQSYSNGSYAWMSTKGWRNIPKELAVALIHSNTKEKNDQAKEK